MVAGDFGRLDGGWKDDGLQVLHSSGGPPLGHFLATGGSLGDVSQLVFVEGIEESLVELLVWP